MKTRAAARFGQRLRDVDAEACDGNAVPKPQARGVFEHRIGEIVEGIADVVKGGDTEVARQVADELDRAGGKVPAANALAADLRRQLVQAEAAHAALAAREEALRGRQLGKIRDATRA